MKAYYNSELMKLVATLRWGPRVHASTNLIYLSYKEISQLVHTSYSTVRKYCMLMAKHLDENK